MKTVFVRPDRCLGCKQCELACAVEHSASKEPALAVYERPTPKPRIHVESADGMAYPGRCRHCDPAPCVLVCPTGAMHRDPELGLVLVDDHKCITCAMCAMVCPFDAVTFHPTATKCDGCIERMQAHRVPACVEVCKTGALEFGELDELVRMRRARGAAQTIAAWRSAS